MTPQRARSVHVIPPLRRILPYLLFALLPILSVVSSFGYAQAPKRVLVISIGSRLAPGFVLVDQQILRALSGMPAGSVETYTENLDVIRLPAQRSQQIFTEYLAAK